MVTALQHRTGDRGVLGSSPDRAASELNDNDSSFSLEQMQAKWINKQWLV